MSNSSSATVKKEVFVAYDGYVLPTTRSQLDHDLSAFHNRYIQEFGRHKNIEAGIAVLHEYLDNTTLTSLDVQHVFDQMDKLENLTSVTLLRMRLQSQPHKRSESDRIALEIVTRKYNYIKNINNIILELLNYK